MAEYYALSYEVFDYIYIYIYIYILINKLKINDLKN